MRVPIDIYLTNKFPFIKWIGFKEQWDMDKQPFICLFYLKNNRTDRIFTI